MWIPKTFVILLLTALVCSAQDELVTSPTTVKPTLPPMDGIIPNLSLEPSDGQIYQGERAVLRCIADDSSPDWEHMWFNGDDQLPNLNPSSNSYTIEQANSGTYRCKIRRGQDGKQSSYSPSISLNVADIPIPTLEKRTPWLDVFPSESVELSCGVQGSSDWSYTWFRGGRQLQADQTVTMGPDGGNLTISAGKTHSGQYTCQGQHRTRKVSTRPSNPLTLKVNEKGPKPLLTQDPSLEQMYFGESVSFACQVDGSSGWEYLWYKDGSELNPPGIEFTIKFPSSTDSGIYWCGAKRGTAPFLTDSSKKITLQFTENPVPTLEKRTQWLDVFPSESVELSCGVQGSSDWSYTWFRGGRQLQADQTVTMDPDGTALSLSAMVDHKGVYSCKGQHKTRKVSTSSSKTLDLTVYESKPTAMLVQDPVFEEMYLGEPITFGCAVKISSGWDYLWYKDQQDPPLSHTGTSYTITSPDTSHSGTYWCRARRGKTEFYTEYSKPHTLRLLEVPVPTLEKRTQWLDVFPSEKVELSCGVQGSSDWSYTWFRGGSQLQADQTVTMGPDGGNLIISAGTTHSGQYTCQGQHRTRKVSTRPSNPLTLAVSAGVPAPVLLQSPVYDKMYIGEALTFSCKVEGSSGWDYLWYKDQQDPPLSHTGTSYTITSPDTSHNGTYWCRARRGKPEFYTEYSKPHTLRIAAIPVPTLENRTQWLDVFPSERVELSCGIQGSSDWSYTWFRGGSQLQADQTMTMGLDGSTLIVHSGSTRHDGEYICKGGHKTRPVKTLQSAGLSLKIYDKKPKPRLTQYPDIKTMYTDETLVFGCAVNVSSGWEYLWYKDLKNTPEPHTGASYTIESAAVPHKETYRCRARRGKTAFYTEYSEVQSLDVQRRPRATLTLETGWTEVFSTDSLALRCEIEESPEGHHWNYTWFREGTALLPDQSGNRFTVTPQDDQNQSNYACQGNSTARPSFSVRSEPFRTKNLALKRKVLLSISGCLFFGIIAVFLGCIGLRLTRKPANKPEKTAEKSLFLTTAELKARNDAPCPLIEYVTEPDHISLNNEINGDATICSETTPLPIAEQGEVSLTIYESNEMKSFM